MGRRCARRYLRASWKLSELYLAVRDQRGRVLVAEDQTVRGLEETGLFECAEY